MLAYLHPLPWAVQLQLLPYQVASSLLLFSVLLARVAWNFWPRTIDATLPREVYVFLRVISLSFMVVAVVVLALAAALLVGVYNL